MLVLLVYANGRLALSLGKQRLEEVVVSSGHYTGKGMEPWSRICEGTSTLHLYEVVM